ncbi:MAG: hypothetical protein PHC88_01855 [Terrimicrobiaceae bacterium]|nr:hypothetical protein [Terrimicrobiaceae bacterium]
MNHRRIDFRVAFFAAILSSLLGLASSARADWSALAGTYAGQWKSADSDGKSYAGKATVKITAGPGNKATLTLKTSFLGSAINGSARSVSNGNAKFTVSNLILGTVTGAGRATASGKKGTLTGSGPLYSGTAGLSAKLHATATGLTVSGTLTRTFPFIRSVLNISFTGKKQ